MNKNKFSYAATIVITKNDGVKLVKYIPKIEGEKTDSGFKGFGFTDEYCSHCENETYNTPSDRVSLCPHCLEELFPCAACSENNRCEFDMNTLNCQRFKHSKENKEKRAK